MWDLIVSVPDHCLSFYFSPIFVSCDCYSPRKQDVMALSL